MKKLAEDANREKALKGVATSMAKKKSNVVKKKAQSSEKVSGEGEIGRGGGQAGGC